MPNLHKFICLKNAFTLAETLIVITIIGVVAALTLKTLYSSWEEVQWTAALKKNYQLISDATIRIREDNGGTLVGAFTNLTTARDLYSQYLQYIKTCDGNASLGDCWNSDYAKRWDNGQFFTGGGGSNTITWWGASTSITAVLLNGTALYFHLTNINCSKTTECLRLFVDTNGLKEPNTMGKDIYYFFIYTDRISPNAWDGGTVNNYGQNGAYMGKYRLAR